MNGKGIGLIKRVGGERDFKLETRHLVTSSPTFQEFGKIESYPTFSLIISTPALTAATNPSTRVDKG